MCQLEEGGVEYLEAKDMTGCTPAQLAGQKGYTALASYIDGQYAQAQSCWYVSHILLCLVVVAFTKHRLICLFVSASSSSSFLFCFLFRVPFVSTKRWCVEQAVFV